MSNVRRMITERDLDVLAAVALSVGQDVWNPEGGLSTSTPDSEIVEVVFDIAQGEPHRLEGVEAMRRDLVDAYIIEHFWKGVGDAAVR
jgi:hypothetical protein